MVGPIDLAFALFLSEMNYKAALSSSVACQTGTDGHACSVRDTILSQGLTQALRVRDGVYRLRSRLVLQNAQRFNLRAVMSVTASPRSIECILML